MLAVKVHHIAIEHGSLWLVGGMGWGEKVYYFCARKTFPHPLASSLSLSLS